MKKKLLVVCIVIILIISSVAVIFYMLPTIEKNVFLRYVKRNEFNSAAYFYNTHSTDAIFKEDAESLIVALDEQIKKVNDDLYNENVNLTEVQALVDLYNDLATNNDLPTDGVDNLMKNLDMYKELAKIASDVEQGHLFSVAKTLLNTKYHNSNEYKDVAKRYITSSNKSKLISKIDDVFMGHLNAADCDCEFATVPSFFYDTASLYEILLTESERNDYIKKVNEHNESRTCTVEGCKDWTIRTSQHLYCREHKCRSQYCEELADEVSENCSKHSCAVSGCTYSINSLLGGIYCHEHECKANGCLNYNDCDEHPYANMEQNYSTSKKADKEKCPSCNGSGYVKYYYGASDLEAYLDGYDPYTVGECTMCDGKGY